MIPAGNTELRPGSAATGPVARTAALLAAFALLSLPGLPAVAQGGPAPAAKPAGGQRPAAGRRVRFNGRALTAEQVKTLERLERQVGRLPDGDYWYDPRTGASGRWGGPGLALLAPGLDLGGPLPAEASGGGKGTLTGVFINGRELNQQDVAALLQITPV